MKCADNLFDKLELTKKQAMFKGVSFRYTTKKDKNAQEKRRNAA